MPCPSLPTCSSREPVSPAEIINTFYQTVHLLHFISIPGVETLWHRFLGRLFDNKMFTPRVLGRHKNNTVNFRQFLTVTSTQGTAKFVKFFRSSKLSQLCNSSILTNSFAPNPLKQTKPVTISIQTFYVWSAKYEPFSLFVVVVAVSFVVLCPF